MYQDQIRAAYAHFSPGYRRIADFLLNRYQDAVFMTAAEIGRSAQVDTALVVRFAQRLGYPGFPELIAEVQDHVRQELRAVYQPAEGDDSPVQVFRRNLLQDRNNLDYMLMHLDEGSLKEVVRLLGQAPRVFVIGEGHTDYLAEAFAGHLWLLGISAHTISSEVTRQASVLAILTPSDVVVGIGVTALNPGSAVVIRAARAAGSHTIGIVASMTNPVATAAQYVLQAPVLTVGMLPSWTAIAAVLHAIVQVLATEAGDLAAERAMREDHFLGIYEETLRKDLARVRGAIAEYNVVP